MDTGVRHLLQTNQEEVMICVQVYYLLPELRKRKLITDLEFRQLSDDKKTTEEKNKALLRAIETKGGEKSFDLFLQALEAEKQHMGHEHLAKVLRDAKAALQLYYLLPELRKRNLVTDLEFRQFSDDKKTSEDKNKALLRLIETKGGERSFDLFVQALETEKQHIGHEHLAKVLRDAKAVLKSRQILLPPKPLPKPKKNNAETSLGTSDNSSLSDHMKQIDCRLANLEKAVHEISQKFSDKSFENKVNAAMEDLHNKVDVLNTLIESHKVDDIDDCKSPISATPEYHNVMRSNASNDYVEEEQYTVVQAPAKNPDAAYKRDVPEAYMSLQTTDGKHNEKEYEKPVPQKKYNQSDYVETNTLTVTNAAEFWLAINRIDGTKVVIKKATGPPVEVQVMLGQEVHALTCCHHPNIVRLITPILSQQVPSLVYEYAEKGQLKEYLQNEKERLRESDLIGMAANVACGMAELEKRGFVHCNLKSSNILIDKDLVCKIASFSKVLCLKGSEKYKIHKSHRIAIRWQAPEVLSDYKYSVKSDVWSFGAFLSELFTYGDKPYPNMKADEVKMFVLTKKKMSQPSNCPKEVYKLMKECFESNIERRPSFDTLHRQLKKLQCKLYRKSSSDSDEYT